MHRINKREAIHTWNQFRNYTQYSGKMLIALVPRFPETSSASVGQQQLRTLQQLQTAQTSEFENNWCSPPTRQVASWIPKAEALPHWRPLLSQQEHSWKLARRDVISARFAHAQRKSHGRQAKSSRYFPTPAARRRRLLPWFPHIASALLPCWKWSLHLWFNYLAWKTATHVAQKSWPIKADIRKQLSQQKPKNIFQSTCDMAGYVGLV